jgi:hypothetical protein
MIKQKIVHLALATYLLAGTNFALAETKALPKKVASAAEDSSSSSVTEAKAYNGQPMMQFNTLGNVSNSSDRDSIKFKVPGDGSPSNDKMANPMESQTTETAFKTYVGYPKQQIDLSYAPVSYGGKFSYSGYDFNFSSTDMLGLNLNYKMILTPAVFFEVDGTYFSAKSKSGRAAPYTFQETTTAVFNVMFRGNYCWIGDNFFSKLCPGIDLGMDSYPVLGFDGNSTVTLQKASELVYGVSLYAQRPLIYSTNISARLGYTMGSGSGQSGALTSKKNNLVYLDSKIEWPVAMNRLINFGVYYSQRTASIEGKVSSTLSDKWDTNAAQLGVKVGYTWELVD